MIDIPNTSGIYKITCTVTGKFYLGSSGFLRERRNQHFNELQQNKHGNPYLQNAWNKYGPDVFTFEVLELVLPMSLIAREQYWFKKLKPFRNKGYNIAIVAGSPMSGRKHTPECIAKQKARKVSPETRAKLSASQIGRPSGMLGKPAWNKGKKASPEVCAKLSVAHAKQMKTLIVTSPDGTEYVITGVGQFCREHNLDDVNLLRVANGKRHQYKGWIARYAECEEVPQGWLAPVEASA